jgi:hypothetical protein
MVAFRKQWRWVGAFSGEAMLCVARARVGVARTAWWAVWDGSALRSGSRGVSVSAERACVRGVLDLTLSPGRPIEATTGPAWTRKAPLRVSGTLLGRPFSAAGLLDESAGRHARRTSWLWSAGAGVAESGEEVVWNLVAGMHPGENTVWVGGEPHAIAPPRFDGLHGVDELAFTALATRAHRTNYVVIASDYEQPFGTFTGELPVAGPLRGWGVMERHEARW